MGNALYMLVVGVEGAVTEIEKHNPNEAKRLLDVSLDNFFAVMRKENPALFDRYFRKLQS